jgi:tRNA pseudouridine38-40 synthase
MNHAYSRNCEIKSGVDFPQDMRRIALCIEYCGASYNGFQKQASNPNTIQEKLERALSDIAQEDITLVCAGRTDAGVHASAQIVHFDTVAERPDKAWLLGTNTKLPDDIRVRWALQADAHFHARFSAQQRTYRYIFYTGASRSAILANRVTHLHYGLDVDSMVETSRLLVGEHDFSAFRSSQCQAHSPVRNISEISWFKQGELQVMQISANAFLHHMVRNIMGSLFEVGRGAESRAWLADVLASGDRSLAGPTAAPWGLYLCDVRYPGHFKLPELSLGPVFLA